MTRSYAWPLTVQAGEDLRLHVSTEHRRFGVRLFRVGAAGLSVLAAGLGILWALVDEESLTWHDHISKTYPTPF